MRLSSLALADESGRRAGLWTALRARFLRRAASAHASGAPHRFVCDVQRRKSHGSEDESRAAGGSGPVARRAAVGGAGATSAARSGVVRPADRARGGLRTLAAAEAASTRAGGPVTSTRASGARIETFAWDFAPRMPTRAAATASSRAGSASTSRPSCAVGQDARWIEPSCHQDQTSSVTYGRNGASSRSTVCLSLIHI